MTDKNKQVREKTGQARDTTGSGDRNKGLAPPADSLPAAPAVPTAMLVPEEPNGPGAKG